MKPWHGYLGLIIAMAGVFLASMCYAEESDLCGSVKEMIQTAHERYGEVPSRVGIGPEKALMMLENLEAGTVTFLNITRDGHACVVGAASNWKVIKPKGTEALQ